MSSINIFTLTTPENTIRFSSLLGSTLKYLNASGQLHLEFPQHLKHKLNSLYGLSKLLSQYMAPVSPSHPSKKPGYPPRPSLTSLLSILPATVTVHHSYPGEPQQRPCQVIISWPIRHALPSEKLLHFDSDKVQLPEHSLACPSRSDSWGLLMSVPHKVSSRFSLRASEILRTLRMTFLGPFSLKSYSAFPLPLSTFKEKTSSLGEPITYPSQD